MAMALPFPVQAMHSLYENVIDLRSQNAIVDDLDCVSAIDLTNHEFFDDVVDDLYRALVLDRVFVSFCLSVPSEYATVNDSDSIAKNATRQDYAIGIANESRI